MASSARVLALLFLAPLYVAAFVGCPSAALARHSTAAYAAKFKPSFVLRVELTHIYPAPIQRVLSPRQRASGSSSSVSMMAKPVQLPTEDSFVAFEEAVLKRELPVMVYFHAIWCGPCIMQSPVMDKMAEDYDGKIDVVKVDCDVHKILMNKYRIRGLPLTGIFIGGEVIAKHEGYLDYDGQVAFMKSKVPGAE